MEHRKINLTIILFILLFSAAYNAAFSAIHPPANSTTTRVKFNDRISGRMSNVDDVGLVVIWNGRGVETALQCAWSSGGDHGSESGDLQAHLTAGDNYIIFILYNKVYEEMFFFKGGKWSYSFALEKNDRTLWTSSDHVKNNSRGVKYSKAHKATVSQSGYVTISDDIDSAAMTTIREIVRLAESALNSSSGNARPF